MFTKTAHIHFVGIGGIGMSGIAKILASLGYTISGCDLDLTQKSVRDLLALGCIIHQGNNTPACSDNSIDILVYSSAIAPTNAEILAAQQRGIPTIPRALMLAELMRMKYSIAISGAHGKTTTTSFISHMLLETQHDPTVIIGGHLHTISSNAQLGDGDFLVAEADESDRSLTRLSPTIAVVTNIDAEHLDVYKDIDDIKNTFKQFLSNIPFYGKAIICYDDLHARSLLPLNTIKTITYGLSPEAELHAQNCVIDTDRSSAHIYYKDHLLGAITLMIPGKHNILNALATIAVGLQLEIPFTAIAQALHTFKGVDRRFTYKGTYKGAELFDDYGHHPTEIDVTLAVARKRARKKLIVVFQPHRYTRTYHLWNDFIRVLSQHPIDELIITDIYAASEQPITGITSKRLVAELKASAPQISVHYVPYDDERIALAHQVTTLVEADDLVLLLGAGKMNMLADTLQTSYQELS